MEVHDTTELLEMILVRLPPQHLLLSQNISRKCRDLVKTSPKLQRKLFYKPAENVSLHLIEGWYDIATRISNNERCSWTRATNPAQLYRLNKRSYFAKDPTSSAARIITVNPLLTKILVPQKHSQHGFTKALELAKLEADARGSWRGMYITHPPVKEVKVECETVEWFSWTRVLGVKARDGVGVRMGDVVDGLAEGVEVVERKVVGVKVLGAGQVGKGDGRGLGMV